MRESEVYSKKWKVSGGIGEKMPEGVTAIENSK